MKRGPGGELSDFAEVGFSDPLNSAMAVQGKQWQHSPQSLLVFHILLMQECGEYKCKTVEESLKYFSQFL